MSATREVQIVATDLETDPVASGYASTLARPGGNLTGIFLDLPEFSAKRLEILKEALPTVSRVMVLWDASLDRAPLSKMDAAARVLKLRLIFAEMRTAADLDNAFEAGVKSKPQAVMVMQSPTLDAQKYRILNLAAKHRLPVFAVFAFFTADGALLSYGPNAHDMVVRSAEYVGRVLQGKRSSDLPIQRPTTFDMVANLKSAKSLGLTIGQSVLLRADKVIQ
jgi:putative ABC transport system substrate-binding protein